MDDQLRFQAKLLFDSLSDPQEDGTPILTLEDTLFQAMQIGAEIALTSNRQQRIRDHAAIVGAEFARIECAALVQYRIAAHKLGLNECSNAIVKELVCVIEDIFRRGLK